MEIFRNLSKSLKSTVNPKFKVFIYVCEIPPPFLFSLWFPKPKWPAIFKLKVKSGITVFWTTLATGHSIAGTQTAPKSSAMSLFTPSLHRSQRLLQSKISTSNVETCNCQGLHPQMRANPEPTNPHGEKQTRGDNSERESNL